VVNRKNPICFGGCFLQQFSGNIGMRLYAKQCGNIFHGGFTQQKLGLELIENQQSMHLNNKHKGLHSQKTYAILASC